MVIPLHERPRSGPYSGLNARSAKRFLTQQFNAAGLPFAEEDALEIVLAATGLTRTTLALQGTEFLDPETFTTIREHADRRVAGEPIDHILGWREFYGRRFRVTQDVLSPRADTETLVRLAIKNIKGTEVLELGVGSGAVLLSVLAERDRVRGTGTDISSAALNIAQANAKSLSLQAQWHQGSWWEAVSDTTTFDAVLSNPPYITNAAMTELEREVIGYDPDISLRGGPDGLDAYRVILADIRTYLRPGGWLGLEIGYDQGASVSDLCAAVGLRDITVTRDLGGHPRVVSAIAP